MVWAVAERGSTRNRNKDGWPVELRNELKLLHALRCGIQWLLCRDGGVR